MEEGDLRKIVQYTKAVRECKREVKQLKKEIKENE
jgi:hypothetical protein